PPLIADAAQGPDGLTGPKNSAVNPVPRVQLTRVEGASDDHRDSGEPSREEQTHSPALVTISDDNSVRGFVNQSLHKAWEDHEVTPAPLANDAEWIRRVHLDLSGRIPTPEETERFFKDSRSDKRARVLNALLESRDFATHFATVWTNLLVGRSQEQEFDRGALFAWLEGQFGKNRSWRETVTELIAARGTGDESGPANYLLAHLNNEAVPATAVTARTLLCEQLQCTQCHVHPTAKDWGQGRFWELNAFFQQARVETHVFVDQETGERTELRELVDWNSLEPTYYETLQGVIKVAYPRLEETEITQIPADESRTLREQLAELLFADEDFQVAKAFVNRTWAHFFGYGFTSPIDDMGPHTPVSHPELLDGLSRAFVDSGYDIKKLIRWVCLSEPYQLSSHGDEVGVAEGIDVPEQGEQPLFSRMYPKSLTAEQIFDSLMVAAGVSPVELHRLAKADGERERWLQQFFVDLETEENSEVTTLDGSLPQTLLMMNGDLIQRAVSPDQGAVVGRILGDNRLSETEKIRELCLAALSRYPDPEEVSAIRQALRRHVKQRTDRNVPARIALNEGLRDVYWAYLNSSEFLVNR
ncbi:MAG: DUF1553 domain-containing protein, partial [Planctomycetaceae bacterium]|nr:DUF1553 domain-containing protein [Planctomycetaceae bacterium]